MASIRYGKYFDPFQFKDATYKVIRVSRKERELREKERQQKEIFSEMRSKSLLDVCLPIL